MKIDIPSHANKLVKTILLKIKSLTLSSFYVCREIALVIGMLIAFLFAPLIIAGNPHVRAVEYGPIGFLCVWYIPLTLLFKVHQNSIAKIFFSHRAPPNNQFPIQLQIFFRAAPYFFLAFVVLPYLASDKVTEALNPMSYWKAKASEKNDCEFSHNALQSLRENVVVAANKLNMGIGTTQELRNTKQALDLMKGTYDGCDARYAADEKQAQSKLNELVLASADIPTLARRAWGGYEPTVYEYRIYIGKVQRREK